MNNKLKSDADLKQKAVAFFGFAVNAVCNDHAQFTILMNQGRFHMYNDIVFDMS